MSKLYRLVSDYGYGDRTWTHKTFSNWSTRPTLEEAMSSEGIYSVEEDNEDDVEDWDWQSS